MEVVAGEFPRYVNEVENRFDARQERHSLEFQCVAEFRRQVGHSGAPAVAPSSIHWLG
jgi:hypothetical protein